MSKVLKFVEAMEENDFQNAAGRLKEVTTTEFYTDHEDLVINSMCVLAHHGFNLSLELKKAMGLILPNENELEVAFNTGPLNLRIVKTLDGSHSLRSRAEKQLLVNRFTGVTPKVLCYHDNFIISEKRATTPVTKIPKGIEHLHESIEDIVRSLLSVSIVPRGIDATNTYYDSKTYDLVFTDVSTWSIKEEYCKDIDHKSLTGPFIQSCGIF